MLEATCFIKPITVGLWAKLECQEYTTRKKTVIHVYHIKPTYTKRVYYVW